jgi:lipoprotein signal peptidase
MMFWRAAVLVFLVDQVVKFWATRFLVLDQSLPVLPPYFYLTLTHNTGIAFGLLEGRLQFVGARATPTAAGVPEEPPR